MAYAEVADVTTLWAREPEPEVIALIQRRLEQVGRMIVRRIPDLANRIAAGDIDEADVVDIEADAVLRAVRNPDGYLSETDGGYTYQLQTDLSSNKLTITDEEWQILGVNSVSRMAVIVPTLATPQRNATLSMGA